MPLPLGTPVALGFDFAEHARLNINWDQHVLSFPDHALRSSVLSEEHYVEPPTDLNFDWLEEVDYEPSILSKTKELVPAETMTTSTYSRRKRENLSLDITHTTFE
jgi:hypothetical protein